MPPRPEAVPQNRDGMFVQRFAAHARFLIGAQIMGAYVAEGRGVFVDSYAMSRA